MVNYLNSFEANLFQFFSMCFGAHSVIIMDFTEDFNENLSIKMCHNYSDSASTSIHNRDGLCR